MVLNELEKEKRVVFTTLLFLFISYMMNHDLLDISRILFILVDKKAQHNKKKVRKMLTMKKK